MDLLYKDITGRVVDCAVMVHKELGPGLLESAYEECLYQELFECGVSSIKQVPMPLIYKGRKLDLGYRLDLLVEDKVVIGKIGRMSSACTYCTIDDLFEIVRL